MLNNVLNIMLKKVGMLLELKKSLKDEIKEFLILEVKEVLKKL